MSRHLLSNLAAAGTLIAAVLASSLRMGMQSWWSVGTHCHVLFANVGNRDISQCPHLTMAERAAGKVRGIVIFAGQCAVQQGFDLVSEMRGLTRPGVRSVHSEARSETVKQPNSHKVLGVRPNCLRQSLNHHR